MISLLINFLFIIIFITIFFFTYACHVEAKIIEDQMNYLANEIYTDFSLYGPTVQKIINYNLQSMKLPDFTETNNKIKDQNNKTIKNITIIIIILSIIILGIVVYLYTTSEKKIKLSEIIFTNLIILLFVGITEYSFLTFYGAKYISINPNQIKHEIIKQLNTIVLNVKSADSK